MNNKPGVGIVRRLINDKAGAGTAPTVRSLEDEEPER